MLTESDPPVFEVLRPLASSPFLLTGDHAGNVLPRALGDLGLGAHDRARHIAWDLGIAELARHLSHALDAFAILHTYSRLAIDVNRPPGTPQSIVTESEGTPIPGNLGLSSDAARARADALFFPYHERIRAELDRRVAAAQPAVLVALHSFTPIYHGHVRRWHAGVLHGRDARLALPLFALLRAEPELCVGLNEPYAVDDETDYAVRVHGEQRGIHHVELEIRNDLIADARGVATWSERLARLLRVAYATLSTSR